MKGEGSGTTSFSWPRERGGTRLGRVDVAGGLSSQTDSGPDTVSTSLRGVSTCLLRGASSLVSF